MRIDALGAEECRAFLEKAQVGRVGVSISALPVVLPVNFAIHNDAIVFRSTPGTKLSEALRQAVVAFEVDDYDVNGDAGWSVLVQGTASQITDPDELSEVRDLPLRLISPGGERDHFIRVAMMEVTGRRVQPCYEDSAEPSWAQHACLEGETPTRPKG